MTWGILLGLLVKLSIVVIPVVVAYFASKKTKNDRLTLLYSLAEIAWKEIEAWGQGLSQKPGTSEKENKFIASLLSMAKSAQIVMTPTEQTAMRQWAKSRSQAAKLVNGVSK